MGNYVDSEGQSNWVYEARKEGDLRKVHAAESRVFWAGLIGFPIFWVVLFILALFRFSFRWLVVDCIALSLNGANVYGYLRCKFGKSTNITGAVSNYANRASMNSTTQNIGKPISPAQNTRDSAACTPLSIS